MKKFQSLTSNLQSFLNCSWVLYLAFFLAVSDLYIFAVNGELFYVALFVLIGILTTFFSKNMTVILMVAMTLTNILRFGKDIRVKEGMESSEESDGVTATKGGSDSEGDDYQYLDKSEDSEAKPSIKSGSVAKPPIIESLNTKSSTATDEPVGAPVASPVASSVDSKIGGLDQETSDLLKKQKKLMENMENLKPMLAQAEAFLNNINKATKESKESD